MSLDDIFAKGGALSASLPNYHPRREQIGMAKAVEKVLLSGGKAVLEAGTGTGKTFAYLIPIIQSGKTALISTGARGLQDQLASKDIPLLTNALGRTVDMTVLKGRNNYVCHQAVVQNSDSANNQWFAEQEKQGWQKIHDFMATTSSGEIGEVQGIPQNSPLWPAVTSTRETCDGQGCDYYSKCFLYKARARAKEADIVIVNHHLFLSDIVLRDSGVAEILPDRDVVVFDEAHLLPPLATQFFSKSFASKAFLHLIKRLTKLAGKELPPPNDIPAHCQQVTAALDSWLQVSGTFTDNRYSASEMTGHKGWMASFTELHNSIATLEKALLPHVAKSEKIQSIALRIKEHLQFLAQWQSDNTSQDEEAMMQIHWVEMALTQSTANRQPHSQVTLYMAPVSGRYHFARQWESVQSVILTSATLSVNKSFKSFCDEVAVAEETAQSWDSPYDFAGRTMLYLPNNLPPPTDREHTPAVVACALPLIEANKGRAFMLFSSLSAMRWAAKLMAAPLQAAGIEILKQGDMANDVLINQFKKADKAVLIGSLSFWQGVDVKGPTLSLVIIDKIPFTPPTDPVLLARDKWRKTRGEDPFMFNQLPNATILVKQVAGRLMRDFSDYGLFMVGDNRLQTRGYGKKILHSLPPMKQNSDAAAALKFLQQFKS